MTTHRIARIAGLLSLALLGGACPGESTPGAGAASAGGEQEVTHETIRVAEDVHSFRHGHHYNFFVVTSEGVVAFDPLNPKAAAHYVEAIREVAPDAGLRAIIYSHDHSDHASGAQVLLDAFGQDTPIIAHERVPEWVRRRGDPDLLMPTKTVGDHTTLEFGDTTVELHYLGDAHTDTMLVALLPERDIAFAVDFVSKDRVGWRDLPGIDMDTQVAQIRRLLELDTVAFGHGGVGDRQDVEEQLQYYEGLRREVIEAVEAGLSEDETVERVAEELGGKYRDWGSYGEWFRSNVRGVYEWATERRDEGGDDGEADVDESGNESAKAPTPYTAEQIREACPAGRWSVYEITTPEGTFRRRTEFVEATEEQATFESVKLDEDGEPAGEPQRSSASWEELRKHASYPQEATAITETEVETPAGTFEAKLYTVTVEDGEHTQVTRAWFAKELPGPPVKQEVTHDGELVSRMVLVSYERPEE